MRYVLKLPIYSLPEVLTNHSAIVDQLMKKVSSPLQVFREYLMYGAYPFFMEGEDEYLMRISQLINVIIDYDLPETQAIETSTLSKLKLLLYVISTSDPFTPNITKLAQQTNTSRSRLLEMLHLLEQAQLIDNLRSSTHG